MRAKHVLFWERRGAEACADGFDREHLISALIDMGYAPASNEHRMALRGWDERNAAELRAACSKVIEGEPT